MHTPQRLPLKNDRTQPNFVTNACQSVKYDKLGAFRSGNDRYQNCVNLRQRRHFKSIRNQTKYTTTTIIITVNTATTPTPTRAGTRTRTRTTTTTNSLQTDLQMHHHLPDDDSISPIQPTTLAKSTTIPTTTPATTTQQQPFLLSGHNTMSMDEDVWNTPLNTSGAETRLTFVDMNTIVSATNIIPTSAPPTSSHVMFLAPSNPLMSSASPTLVGDFGPAATSSSMANTTKTLDGDDDLNSFYFYETEQFAVLWILFTIIVLGNSAVLFVMFVNKNRKSRMNYFIKQLAFADLFVGLLNVLTDIIWRITISWRAGNVACKVIRFSQVCVTYASTYVLVAMSIDRYDAITHPMNFSKSWRRARHLVAWAWIVSALFSLPILWLYEETDVQKQTQCWIELGSPWAWQVYMTLVSVTLFAFPALIISACYAIIVKTIWAKGSIFVPAERAGYGNPATRRASSRGIIPRAKVKTVKMTFVIVFVFIVCWSPYIIFDLLQVFGHIPQTQTNIAIATFIQSLAPLNSAANPVIYCLFSSQVFRTFSRFAPFKWFTCCCQSYRSNSVQNRCNTVGRRLHNSCDSMRTLTTSLTVSRRSNKAAPARVVICETPASASAPATTHAISEV